MRGGSARLGVLALALALGALAADGTEPERRILRLATGRVETVPLEAYVAAVLPAEIGTAPEAAMEAQAVAARSYAVAKGSRHADGGADLCDGTHCQVYRGLGAATGASRRAAAATAGLVLVQADRVIPAPFHAVCGGRTARPSDVWDDEETPDLVPVDDDACVGTPGASWTFHLGRPALRELGASLGIPDARFVEVFGEDGSGRASAVRLVSPGGRSLVVRAFEFRKAANELWGWATVRSTAFAVAGETRSEYVLSGRGTGHGAGLCQVGAVRRARRGESRDAILAHYYPGTRVRALPSGSPSRPPGAVAGPPP